MENLLKYYQFSDFLQDMSGSFSKHEIAYTELNATHFLIFEKKEESYTLYVAKYGSRKEIGSKPPEILELLLENYDKSIPDHRLIFKQYLH